MNENIKPTVSVLLSTYNGQKYIKELVDSVLAQEGVNVKLQVRDDGSEDNTIGLLELCANKYGNMKIEKGDNIGWQRSFMHLVSQTPESDYYAFSDQDDFWMPQKMKSAIEMLEAKEDVCLYASSLTLTDKNLRVISEHSFGGMPETIESVFTRPRIAGCTFVFDNTVQKAALRVLKYINDFTQYPAHDFLIQACAVRKGNIVVDPRSFILHRRLQSSQTGGYWVSKTSKVRVQYGIQ